MFGLDSNPLCILLLLKPSIHASSAFLIVCLFGIRLTKFKVGTSRASTSVSVLDAVGLCDAYPLEHLSVNVIGSVSGSGLWSIGIPCGVIVRFLRALDVVSANFIVIHGPEFAGSCKYTLDSIPRPSLFCDNSAY